MKALVGAFNHEKALVGAFSVIVQLVVEPMEQYIALHWTLTMWKYSFVASNCPDHHPAGAGAGVAVTFSWQLLACSWYLHILRCPDTGTGLDLAGWSPPLHTGKRVLDLKVPQYRSHGPFYRSSLFLGLYATQFLVLDLCHFNMLGLCFPTANQIN